MTVKGSFMFEIEFYALPDGRKPVEEFLDSLPVKMRVKALDSLDLLEEYGNQLRMPYSKALSDGIFELRIRFSGDISRIFYFFCIGNKIIVTNGFIKKTQKTPSDRIMKEGICMSDLQKYKKKQLQDAEFKAEYERTRPEFEIMRALVDARISQHMTQKELAEKSGVRQSNISRIENGTCSPTIATLEALANGMGKKLIVSFE